MLPLLSGQLSFGHREWTRFSYIISHLFYTQRENVFYRDPYHFFLSPLYIQSRERQ